MGVRNRGMIDDVGARSDAFCEVGRHLGVQMDCDVAIFVNIEVVEARVILRIDREASIALPILKSNDERVPVVMEAKVSFFQRAEVPRLLVAANRWLKSREEANGGVRTCAK